MRETWRLRLIRRMHSRKKINTMRVTVVVFLAMILAGTLLLMLPMSSRDGQSRGIGTALLIRTLEAMRDYGYGYAIIGWVDDAALFYEKTVGAQFIPGGTPDNSVYANMLAF